MFSALSAGVVLGLSAGLTPGPLLTLVITQTLRHNIREGIKVALAPLITDVPIIVISLLVLGRLSDFNRVLGLISIAGGIYVLYLAYESARTGPVDLQISKEHPRSLKKGSLINIFNPNPYLFWITVGAPLMLKMGAETRLAPVIFVLCFYLLLVGLKVCMAVIVGKSRSFLSGRIYVNIMRSLGVVLALFALFLFKDAVQLLGIVPSIS